MINAISRLERADESETGLYHIYPEEYGTWNDTQVWKEALSKIV